MEDAEQLDSAAGKTVADHHEREVLGLGTMDSRNGPFPTMARSSMGGLTAPQHLPHKFTNETLMYVVVCIKPENELSKTQSASSLLPKKLQWLTTRRSSSSTSSKHIKVVRVPRREYLAHFLRNANNEYCGSEPERQWTEQELDDAFGKYWARGPTRWVPGGGRYEGQEAAGSKETMESFPA